MPSSHHAPRLLALVACTVLVLAGCGDDDDAGTASDPPATSAPVESDFCDAALAVEVAPEPEIDSESVTEEEIVATVQAFAADVLRPLADDVVATAPRDVAAEAGVLSEAVDGLAGGDLDAMASPEVQAASTTFDAFVDDECGWTSLTVTATDYSFGGIPETVGAGPVRVRLANDGEEAHEVLVVRRNAGTDQSIEDLLALSQEAAFELVTPAGNPAFATPGGRESVVLDLGPGSYIALCLIPTGLVDESSVPAPGALPHAANGMVAEFTVS